MILFCFRIPDRLTMDSSEIFRGGGEQCHHCQAVEQQLLLATEENGTVEPMPPTIDCPLGDCHVTAGLCYCNSSSWLQRNYWAGTLWLLFLDHPTISIACCAPSSCQLWKSLAFPFSLCGNFGTYVSFNIRDEHLPARVWKTLWLNCITQVILGCTQCSVEDKQAAYCDFQSSF